MSLDATRWAWKQKIRPSMKLILLSLADRANETHCCFPSVKRLAFDTCLNRKTILSGLEKLESLGVISIKKQKGKGNFYQLIGVECRTSTSAENGTCPKIGTSTNYGTGTSPTKEPAPVPKQGHKSTSNLPINLPDYIDSELFDDFWAMRSGMKNIRQTERAQKLLLAELEKLRNQGYNPDEVISRSIRNSWKDFYPLSNQSCETGLLGSFPE